MFANKTFCANININHMHLYFFQTQYTLYFNKYMWETALFPYEKNIFCFISNQIDVEPLFTFKNDIFYQFF